jgi:hypothetical protein
MQLRTYNPGCSYQQAHAQLQTGKGAGQRMHSLSGQPVSAYRLFTSARFDTSPRISWARIPWSATMHAGASLGQQHAPSRKLPFHQILAASMLSCRTAWPDYLSILAWLFHLAFVYKPAVRHPFFPSILGRTTAIGHLSVKGAACTGCTDFAGPLHRHSNSRLPAARVPCSRYCVMPCSVRSPLSTAAQFTMCVIVRRPCSVLS